MEHRMSIFKFYVWLADFIKWKKELTKWFNLEFGGSVASLSVSWWWDGIQLKNILMIDRLMRVTNQFQWVGCRYPYVRKMDRTNFWLRRHSFQSIVPTCLIYNKLSKIDRGNYPEIFNNKLSLYGVLSKMSGHYVPSVSRKETLQNQTDLRLRTWVDES